MSPARCLLRASSRDHQPIADPLDRSWRGGDYLDLDGPASRSAGRSTPRRPADASAPLSVQSLVENAVKHGFTPDRSGGKYACRRRRMDSSRALADPAPIYLRDRAGHGSIPLGTLDALFSSAHLTVSRSDGGASWRCVPRIMSSCYLVATSRCYCTLSRLLGDKAGRRDRQHDRSVVGRRSAASTGPYVFFLASICPG